MAHVDEQRIPPRPAISRFVAAWFNRLNTLFDYLYHSEYNPFYRSGTLAIGLLFVLLATGFYLLFFYSVSAPYESIVELQNQVLFGRWIRALHRYATDAALIAVIFHVLQLLAHGKTWGPRTLAWVSGVMLLGALFVSAWTGYVMVWDQHGQRVALSGMALLNSIPFLGSEISQSFSGEHPVPASFFFMNLFLHIAIPLGMVLGMWIHTARLARTVWFPIRSVFYGSLAALTILSLLVPAVLLPKADLLRVVGAIPTDWWFGFWIPLIERSSANAVLLAWFLFAVAAISVPWWWRPQRKLIPGISQVDEDLCSGCTQCTRDCPYEAITMVPHSNGKHLLAKVSEAHCVSCGICAASCGDLAIGPAGRSGPEQLERVRAFCDEIDETEADSSIVLFGCSHNDSVPHFLEQHCGEKSDVHYYGLNCCGTLLTDTFEHSLSRVGAVLLVGCAARNCMNRDGLNLLLGRLYGRRVPFLNKKIDPNRVVVVSRSENEKDEIVQAIEDLRSFLGKKDAKPTTPLGLRNRLVWYTKRTIATAILIAILAWLNQLPMGANANTAFIRIVGRLPGQAAKECRAPTAEERAARPLHMQTGEICEQVTVTYVLSVAVDGSEKLKTTLHPGSIRGETPVILFEEIPVPIGPHRVEVSITPSENFVEPRHQAIDVKLNKSEIHLIALE